MSIAAPFMHLQHYNIPIWTMNKSESNYVSVRHLNKYCSAVHKYIMANAQQS